MGYKSICEVYGMQEYVRIICAVYGIHECVRSMCAVYGIHESIWDISSLSHSVVVLIRKEREQVRSIWDTRVYVQYMGYISMCVVYGIHEYVRSIWDTREYMGCTFSLS